MLAKITETGAALNAWFVCSDKLFYWSPVSAAVQLNKKRKKKKRSTWWKRALHNWSCHYPPTLKIWKMQMFRFGSQRIDGTEDARGLLEDCWSRGGNSHIYGTRLQGRQLNNSFTLWHMNNNKKKKKKKKKNMSHWQGKHSNIRLFEFCYFCLQES